MKNFKALLRRIEKETTLSGPYFFSRAGVEPRLFYNWKRQEPDSWRPWLRMLRSAGIEVPEPGTTTIDALGGVSEAKEHFLQHGYQYGQIKSWYVNGDPRTIENYKKLVHLLNNLPDDIRRSRRGNDEGGENEA